MLHVAIKNSPKDHDSQSRNEQKNVADWRNKHTRKRQVRRQQKDEER